MGNLQGAPNPAAAAVRTYTVFLASPSADTLEARRGVAEAVRAINLDPLYRDRVRLDLRRWDDPDRALALSAECNAQVDVIDQVADPAECDLVIGLWRHRMGGCLPLEGFPNPAGRRWHCTEWEVAQALEGLAEGRVRKVWRFRDTTPMPAFDPQVELFDEWEAKVLAPFRAVESYFAALNPEPDCQQSSVNFYRGDADLAERIGPMLREWLTRQLERDEALLPLSDDAGAQVLVGGAGWTLADRAEADAFAGRDALTPAQETLLTTLLASPLPSAASDPSQTRLAAEVLQGEVAGWRSHLLRRHAAWSTGVGGQLDRRFVNLTLVLDRSPGAEGERFVPDAERGRHGRYDDLAELLADVADAAAWLLVGDPGCGKSTVLQHHELRCARAALQALAGGQAPQEVVFYVRLSDYRFADPPPAHWLALRWAAQVGDCLPDWEDACRRWPIRVLADGLNEIKAPDPTAQGEAMRRWAAWAAALKDEARGGPHRPPVFSVRTLEIGDGLQGAGLALRYITLGQWNDEQVQRYCEAADAPAVWAGLQQPERAQLLGLCRLPFNLAAQCELFRDTRRLAEDRAELLAGVVWQRLIHELDKGDAGALRAPGLLGPRDRQRIASGQWRQALRALPDQGWLLRGLEAQAERLHRDGKEVSFNEEAALQAYADWANAAVGATAGAALAPAAPQDWLAAAQASHFIGLSGIDKYTGATTLRYTHQLWQEFFAGRALREAPPPAAQVGGALLPDFSAPVLPDLEATAARLGTQDPLPGPPVSHWEEPVKLALQLTTRPLDWLALLEPVNLPLAGRAAAGCRARLEADGAGRAQLQRLRQALLARSRDAAVDLRERIEAAEALGELGDPRYEEGRSVDGVRYLLPTAANWVTIPAGAYRIGSEAGGYDDERPVTEVRLEAFQMAFAPVTNAEYRCFIEAGGYEDERWWDGDTARRWRAEGLRNESQMEFQRQLFADARRDFEGTLGRFPNVTQSDRLWLREMADLTEAQTEAQLEAWYGAQVQRLPQEWSNPRFNAPTQPVVGVCWFEARAYARWLAAVSGRPTRLPLEAEWEAAARGAPARPWPWGEAGPERWQINADPAHLRRSSPVGVFPAGDSPLGLTDLAGNVWEWTLSEFTESLDAGALVREAADGQARRVLRGGAWYGSPGLCRAGDRLRGSPDNRDGFLGFRVVCCPIVGP